MTSLIAHRPEVVRAVLFLLAGSAATAAPGPMRSQGGRLGTAHNAVAGRNLVRLTDFDCEKPLAFPDPKARKGRIAQGAGIRGWRGGGPMGANWNVYDLRCVIRAETTCTNGQASMILRVGQQVVAERRATITGSAVDFDVTVDERTWQKGIDERKGPLRDQPFRTATFRAVVTVDCKAPSKASLRNSNYGDVAAEDSFTAGFASGE